MNKENTKKFIILIIILILLLGIGGITVNTVFNDTNNKQSNNTSTTKEETNKEEDKKTEINNEETTSPEDEKKTENESNVNYGASNNDQSNKPNNSTNTNSSNGNQTTQKPAEELPKGHNKISFFKGSSTANERFNINNILPGDSVVKYYNVLANHIDDLEIYFDVEVKKETKDISEILNVKITILNTNEVMYNGSMRELNNKLGIYKMKKNSNNESTFNLKIEVSMPTSAGNEYQNAYLNADFIWYVENEDVLIPPTGYYKKITLWIVLLIISISLIAFIIFKKKKGDAYEN